ncbi:MAG: hypothetical protein Kow0077_04810 [Anaerolineae bacterium]
MARHLIFVLQDGTIAVQWDHDRVQDIFSGRILPFEDAMYGHAITDAELDQLRDAGRISRYDRAYVWLHSLPEGDRFARFKTREESGQRVRLYYINTTLPAEQLARVNQRLQELGLHTRYAAQIEGDIVAIMQHDGQPFRRLADAENAYHQLQRIESLFFQDIAVAFIEYSRAKFSAQPDDLTETTDLDTLIASQTKRLDDPNTLIVSVDRDEAFLDEMAEVVESLGVKFRRATTGEEALYLIEDHQPSLVTMELVMPDTHAWQILSRMKANEALADIPVIIISGLGTPADQVFAFTVAKVADFLTKPVSLPELRRSIWMALRARRD